MADFLIFFGKPEFGYCHHEECDTDEEAVRRYYLKYPHAQEGAQAHVNEAAWNRIKELMP